MDVLSSQADIAGYKAVMVAANVYQRFMPMLMTAAGTVKAARVVILGVGVAGLQAIATAKRLGAVIEASDVRPPVKEQVESLGAKFIDVPYETDEEREIAQGVGGYARPMPESWMKRQAAAVAERVRQADIVITTALIPGRPAPKLWTEDMVAMMKPGSVIVDLAAERGGNCDLTVPDQRIVTPNGVIVVGYTDFPSRMAQQASQLYATNIRHMVSDLTPAKDGVIVHNMEDDVIRGATAAHQGAITYPPPPPKVAAIAAAKPKEKPKELTPAEKRALEVAAFRTETRNQVALIAGGGLLILLAGLFAPASFMAHFIVFVLACFVGFQVIWNVSHSLHTPLMAITNAISSIIILGALMQIGSGNWLVLLLAAAAVFMAGINIFGGFLVTRRMLAMFQKS
jgi:NAD(P) transhydrogenase subunit alpha